MLYTGQTVVFTDTFSACSDMANGLVEEELYDIYFTNTTACFHKYQTNIFYEDDPCCEGDLFWDGYVE